MLMLNNEQLEETMKDDSIMLIPQTREHASAMFSVLNDSELYTYIGGNPILSLEDIERRFIRLESRKSPDGKDYWLNWVIINEIDELIGYIQATIKESTALIAWVVGTRWQRKKYGRKAAYLVIMWLKKIGCKEIKASINPENESSKRLALSLGFRNSQVRIDDEDIWTLKLM